MGFASFQLALLVGSACRKLVEERRLSVGCLRMQDILIRGGWNLGRFGFWLSLMEMLWVLLSGEDRLYLYIYVRIWQFLLSALRTSTRN